jgi:type II secretory pathway pseudopilin PulG
VSFLVTSVSGKQRGASLLEFAVSVCVLGILIAVLLNRVFFYQGEAERAAVESTVAALRTALEIKVTQLKLLDRSEDLTFLTEENPLNLLKVKPANYSGELYNPSNDDIGNGNWCFDRGDKTLIYLLNKRNSFGDAQTKRLKFKVKLFRLPNSPAKPSGTPEPISVAFEQVKD